MKGTKTTIENGSPNYFVTPYGVPTISLGDGRTQVTDLHGRHEDGEFFAGICFSVSDPFTKVGDKKVAYEQGENVTDIGAYFQIITGNPASIDVLIEELEEAKAVLLSQ